VSDDSSTPGSLQPNTDEAINFLRGWHPLGPWDPVAIPPAGRSRA